MSNFYANVGKNDYIDIGDKIPLWKFLEHYLKPNGWVISLAYRQRVIPHAPLLIDCGALAYNKQEIPRIRGELVSSRWAISQMKLIAAPGDIICSPDHILLPPSNIEYRRKFNRENAEEFLDLSRPLEGVKPMAVCHGLSVAERVEYAQWLYKIGYRAIAIGGLVPFSSNRKYCQAVVTQIKKALPNDCLVHVLGLSSPTYAAVWEDLQIDSFDGRTYQLEAMTGDFYETVGCEIIHHRVAYPGDPITAPLCHCPVCSRLRREGFDTRVSGTRQSSLGRTAHNLCMMIAAQRNAITRRSITLISCVGSKQSVSSPAFKLYNSQWWRAALRYAEMTGANWKALSARHGVVDSDTILDPYDESLNDKSAAARRQWSEMVAEQLHAIALPQGCEVVFLGGKKYRQYVQPLLLQAEHKLYSTRAPLAGLGIGYQLQWFRLKTPKQKYVQLSLLA